MIITTTERIEGKHITKVLGIVHGTGHIGSGRASQAAEAVPQAVDESCENLRKAAADMKADAVVGVRYDLCFHPDPTVLAYGTAVSARDA